MIRHFELIVDCEVTSETYSRPALRTFMHALSGAKGAALLAYLRRKRYDWRYRPVTVWLVVLFNWVRYVLLRRLAPELAVASLLNAHKTLQKLSIYGRRADRVEARLLAAILREFGPDGPGHRCVETDGGVAERERRRLMRESIVLKAPRWSGDEIVEKGVLLIMFVESIDAFRRCADVESVLRDYMLVLEPSWSAYAGEWLMYYTRFREDPVVVMCPQECDTRLVDGLESNLISLKLGNASWANPDIFHPLPGEEKIYDVVMVAGAGRFKRHQALLRALREIADPTYRAALVGLRQKERREVDLLIEAYGVQDNVETFEWLRQPEVNLVLNRSKVAILPSLKEGDNRSLVEAFFAGTPGIAIRNNLSITKSHFNSQTGMLADERDLARALLHFREHWADYDPRAWAQDHITPDRSTATLNSVLKGLASERGEPWTSDIVVKSNSPRVAYYPDPSVGDGLLSMKQILARYGRSG